MGNTVQVEGSSPPQFISELTLLTLDPNKVYKGKPSSSKKAAETSAAEAALRQNNQSKKKAIAKVLGAQTGQKVAAATAPPTSEGKNPRKILAEWLQTKAGGPLTKDSISYNTVEVEGSSPPQFISELILVTLNPNKVYKGKPAPSKKSSRN